MPLVSQQSSRPSPSVSVVLPPGQVPGMVGGPPSGPQVPFGISKAKIWLVKASFDHMAVLPVGLPSAPNVNGSQSRSSVRWPAVANEPNTAPFVLFSWYSVSTPLQEANRLAPPTARPLFGQPVGEGMVPSSVPLSL